MKCPICVDTDLLMTDRNGIEIDYCPKCRGIWLDRGELDKIIERSSEYSQPASKQYHDDRDDRDYHDKKYSDDDYYKDKHHKHKKKNFFSELFDFD